MNYSDPEGLALMCALDMWAFCQAWIHGVDGFAVCSWGCGWWHLHASRLGLCPELLRSFCWSIFCSDRFCVSLALQLTSVMEDCCASLELVHLFATDCLQVCIVGQHALALGYPNCVPISVPFPPCCLSTPLLLLLTALNTNISNNLCQRWAIPIFKSSLTPTLKALCIMVQLAVDSAYVHINDAAARIVEFARGCIHGFLLPRGSPFGKEIATVAWWQFLKHKELECELNNPLPGWCPCMNKNQSRACFLLLATFNLPCKPLGTFLWLPPRISVCQHQVISITELRFRLVF